MARRPYDGDELERLRETGQFDKALEAAEEMFGSGRARPCSDPKCDCGGASWEIG